MEYCCSGVYAIVNVGNGKVYIGSAVILSRRRDDHFRSLYGGYHPNRHLQNAWNKYGPESFEFVEIEFCEPEKCIEREQYWMDHHESYRNENGYNQSPTAGSILGFTHSEETKAAMSERMSGVPMEERVKEKIREALLGQPKSAEHRANLWRNRQGWKHSEESKRRISDSLRKAAESGNRSGPPDGWTHSSETRAKMSESRRGKPKSLEHRAKIAAAVKAARARKKDDSRRSCEDTQ